MQTIPILNTLKGLVAKAFDFSSPFVAAIWIIIILGAIFAIFNIALSSRRK